MASFGHRPVRAAGRWRRAADHPLVGWLMWLAWVPLTIRFRVVLDDTEVRIRRWSKEKVLSRGEWHVKGAMNLSLFRGNTIIQLRSTSGAKVDLPLASMSKTDQVEVPRGVTHALSRPAHR